MQQAPAPLHHENHAAKDDATLRAEASGHLAAHGPLQLVAELVTKLRAGGFRWWTPEQLRTRFTARVRLGWFSQRADVRQRVVVALTGLAPNAARKKDPDFQAVLIDSVIDDGDVSVERFETAFEAAELAVYGPAIQIWREFRERLPWAEDRPEHQAIVGQILRALLTSMGSIEGVGRTPILTPWQMRTAIDGAVWHTKMPLAIRVAIDDSRLKLEESQPNEPFRARDDLTIALPEIISANIPLTDLVPVFDVAERCMGFATSAATAAGSNGQRADSPKQEPAGSEPPLLADDLQSEQPPPLPARGTRRPATTAVAGASDGSVDEAWSDPRQPTLPPAKRGKR